MATCELCERPAGPAYLCPSCADDLVDRLRRLPALYTALGGMLAPERGDGADGRGGTRAEAPLPIRPDVIDARAEFAVLPQWARAAADDRNLPALTSPRKALAAPDDLGARVIAACAALAAAVPWITAQWPSAGDCATAVRTVYDGARSIVGAADLPARMGRCPQVVHGQACGAELLLPAGAQVVHCGWCGATYPPGVWAALKVAQRAVVSPSEGAAAGRPSRASTSAGTRG